MFRTAPLYRVQYRINVSDREVGWVQNYHVPDMTLFLEGPTVKNCWTHYCGGPLFAREVLSPNDRSREKFDFYAAIGTREVMMIDRDPWSLELFRLDEKRMELVAKLVPDDGAAVVSSIAPLQFSMHAGPTRPIIKIVHTTTGEQWEG